MVSDAHRRLSGLLLQQSDRHPIRTLSGADLDGFGADVVRDFEQLGLLVRERDLRDADGIVFHVDGDPGRATSFESGDVEKVSPLALAVYRIEFAEVARLLRTRLGLEGPSVQALSHKVLALGVRGGGRRRQEVYLVRSLRPDRALETLLTIRAHAGGEASVVVLTPTAKELPRSVLRQVQGLQFVSISGLLKREKLPLAIRLPMLQTNPRSERVRARLTVDSGGHVAHFDGVELRLQRRDFGALLLLANEAKNDGGFVLRDLLTKPFGRRQGKTATTSRSTSQ